MPTPFPFQSGAVLLDTQLNDITVLPINDQTASYTLVVGDVGKRVVMNVGSANTVTVNNSVFDLGDSVFIMNKGAGVSTITAGAGVTINVNGSLQLAQHGGGTLVFLSASVCTFFPAGGIGYGTATLSGVGAQSNPITVSGVNYTILSAVNDGTLTVSKAGLFDCLLIGGGGAGGSGIVAGFGTGGGGGAGGVLIQTVFLDVGAYTVAVGAGGTGGGNTIISQQGKATAIEAATRTFTLAAVGGGCGDNRNSNFRLFFPTIGGSGGGGGNSGRVGAVGVSTQGHTGGTGGTSGAYAGGGGGGGGADAVGGNGSGSTGGNGGAGVEINTFIGGASTIKGGGGGGGGTVNGSAGAGSGANNSGGGGDGRANADGTSGFSGMAFIRFKV